MDSKQICTWIFTWKMF